MKKHIPHPSIIFRRLHWPAVYFLTGSFKRKAVILLLMISSFSLSGCFKNFYLTNTKNNAADPEVMSALKNQNKYFVIHFKDDARFALKNFAASDSIIEGDVTKLVDPPFLLYHSPAATSSNRYKKIYEPVVLQEVHIYTSENYYPQKEHIRLAVRSISRIDIYTKDKPRTSTSHVESTVGIAAVGGIVIALLIAISTSNWISF